MCSPCSELPLNAALVSHLECPICLDHCSPPIYTCTNGHHTCAKCRKHVRFCGVCRDPGRPSIRNLFAERVAAEVRLPCGNAADGCGACHNAADMKTHLVACTRRYVCNCRVVYLQGAEKTMCFWEGRKSELLEHVESCHPEFLSRKEMSSFDWDMKGDESAYAMLICAYGELFWAILCYNRAKGVLVGYVRCVGAGGFCYELGFCVNGVPGRFLTALSEKTRTIDEPMLGGKRCGYQVSRKQLKWFLVDGVIRARVVIKKLEI